MTTGLAPEAPAPGHRPPVRTAVFPAPPPRAGDRRKPGRNPAGTARSGEAPP